MALSSEKYDFRNMQVKRSLLEQIKSAAKWRGIKIYQLIEEMFEVWRKAKKFNG